MGRRAIFEAGRAPAAEPDSALPQRGLVGVFGIPPELTAIRDPRRDKPLAVRVLVDQFHLGMEEPVYLISEPCVCAAARGVDVHFSHELGQRPPEDQLLAWVRTASVQTHARSRRGRLP